MSILEELKQAGKPRQYQTWYDVLDDKQRSQVEEGIAALRELGKRSSPRKLYDLLKENWHSQGVEMPVSCDTFRKYINERINNAATH